MTGLEQHGVGNWKTILQRRGFAEGRTAVDLKDKWRNLKKIALNPGISERGLLIPADLKTSIIRLLHLSPERD